MRTAFRIAGFALVLGVLVASGSAAAPIFLRDDVGRRVHAAKPASRIVTLAPFLTDYVVAAGGADLLVGIAELSEPPPVMRRLPRIDDVPAFMVQHLEALRPDLVLAFMDDIRPDEVAKIESTGATVYVANARGLGAVPGLLRAVGSLIGRDASRAAGDFENRIERLTASHAAKPPLLVFLELSHRPLTTAGGPHFLNDALAVCGADNIFRDASAAASPVDWDQVARRDPVAVIGLGSASGEQEFRSQWALRSTVPAARAGRVEFLGWRPGTHPTPGAAAHIEKLCAAMDRVRAGVLGGAMKPR